MSEMRFRVFDAGTDEVVKGHFLLSCDGVLYKTVLGITFKVRHPEKYEVRFIANEVD